jgi:hypothetical protein
MKIAKSPVLDVEQRSAQSPAFRQGVKSTIRQMAGSKKLWT